MRNDWIIAALLLIPAVCFSEWQSEHHGPCNPGFIASDSSGNRVILSLQEYGGIWLTNDRGQSWEQLNSRISTAPMLRPCYECDIQAVGVSADTLILNVYPTYPDSTTSSEFHSLDGGITWATFKDVVTSFWPDSMDNITLNGDPTLIMDDRIYYSRQSGFGISYDDGVSWTIVNINNYESGIQGVLFDQIHPDTVYAYGYWGLDNGTWGPPVGGVIATHNGGTTWQRLTLMEDLTNAEEGFIGDLEYGTNQELYALAIWNPNYPYTPFLYSPDEGESWIWIDPEGLPASVRPRKIMVVPEVPGRILMGTLDSHGVWESSDGAHTWHRLYRGLPEVACKVESFYRNPFSGNLYVCLRHHGVYWSSDSGETWQPLPGPPVGAQCDWFYDGFVIDEGGVYHKTHYPPIYFSVNESDTFQQIPEFDTDPDYFNCRYYPLSYKENVLVLSRVRENIATSQYEQSILQSIDNGNSWNEGEPSSYTIYDIISVNTDSSDVLVGTSDYSSIQVSCDMGASWDYRDAPFYFGQFLEEVNGELIVGLPGSNADFMRSWDLGANWTAMQFPESELIRNGLLTKPLALSDTLLFATLNETWAYLPEGTWQQRGASWNQNIEGFDDVAWAYIKTDADSFIFAGCDQSRDFSISYDHGWTWQHQPVELPGGYQGEVVLDLAYDPWRDRIWVDTAMGLMYKDDPTSAVGEDAWVFQPAKHVTLDAYPNPFNATATIRYTLTRPEAVTVSVFDLLGRQVAELCDGVMRPGVHTVLFDGTGLSSGTYFLHLDTAELTINHKLTLLK